MIVAVVDGVGASDEVVGTMVDAGTDGDGDLSAIDGGLGAAVVGGLGGAVVGGVGAAVEGTLVVERRWVAGLSGDGGAVLRSLGGTVLAVDEVVTVDEVDIGPAADNGDGGSAAAPSPVPSSAPDLATGAGGSVVVGAEPADGSDGSDAVPQAPPSITRTAASTAARRNGIDSTRSPHSWAGPRHRAEIWR